MVNVVMMDLGALVGRVVLVALLADLAALEALVDGRIRPERLEIK